MRPLTRWIKITLLALLLPLAAAAPVGAQIAEKPVMENVFFNVVWGSAAGALVGGAAAIIGSKDKSNPTNLGGSAFQGATIGGIIGLGVGLWLVYAGITFDESAVITSTTSDSSTMLAGLEPPFKLISEPGEPGRISGFSAQVFSLRF